MDNLPVILLGPFPKWESGKSLVERVYSLFCSRSFSFHFKLFYVFLSFPVFFLICLCFQDFPWFFSFFVTLCFFSSFSVFVLCLDISQQPRGEGGGGLAVAYFVCQMGGLGAG